MRIRQLVVAIAFIFICSNNAIAQGKVKIRLFADVDFSSATFTIDKGPYTLRTSDGNTIELNDNNMLAIMMSNKKIVVKNGNASSFSCDTIRIISSSDDSRISIRANGTKIERRTYCGDIIVYHDLGGMMIINRANVEDYIAGVVKAEGGTGRKAEYIKTQAIIARTYLYKYHDRHALDGFNLCDGTHCQVFHGITTDDDIVGATKATKGLIIVDAEAQPIQAAFHSNCGGETANSEDVWLAKLPYLKSVKDPYCVSSSKNSKWEKNIPLSEWTSYLQSKGYRGNNTNLNFSQSKRALYYKAGTFTYPLTEIRNDFNLRSTFFSVSVSGNNVILKGKGYGHGVGLCQEGAIEMARQGKKYKEIINFYYTNVNIVEWPIKK